MYLRAGHGDAEKAFKIWQNQQEVRAQFDKARKLSPDL
tara:strand:- start:22 stop:135 length:114 start_codon:yes stop_codon:yes gene_type:complete